MANIAKRNLISHNFFMADQNEMESLPGQEEPKLPETAPTVETSGNFQQDVLSKLKAFSDAYHETGTVDPVRLAEFQQAAEKWFGDLSKGEGRSDDVFYTLGIKYIEDLEKAGLSCLTVGLEGRIRLDGLLGEYGFNAHTNNFPGLFWRSWHSPEKTSSWMSERGLDGAPVIELFEHLMERTHRATPKTKVVWLSGEATLSLSDEEAAIALYNEARELFERAYVAGNDYRAAMQDNSGSGYSRERQIVVNSKRDENYRIMVDVAVWLKQRGYISLGEPFARMI